MDMTYQRLGASGLKLSTFSLGSWATYGAQVDESTAKDCVLHAYEAGVNFFDSAEVYAQGQAEIVLGRILCQLPREQYIVSSKVFWGGDGPNDVGLNRKHVVAACHGALRRLQVEYLDLYFCHRPDPDTPVEETARTMDRLIRQGKVLYWGTSEWTADQLQEAYDVCEKYGLERPQMEQPQYHMFCRDRVETELAGHVKKYGLGTTTWSPLASGLLTGKYNDGIPEDSRLGSADWAWLKDLVLDDEKIATTRKLAAVSKDLGCTLAQMSLAWTAKHPHVSTVITGASRLSQLKENLQSIAIMDQMDDSVMARIEGILKA
jgi:voltage-dependent potassium channel beta subunit